MRPIAIAMAGLLGGCVSVNFERTRGFEPVADDILLELREGHADLAACLRCLGAPNLVHELPGGGMAFAWAWLDSLSWGIQVSVPVRGFNVCADYDAERRDFEGAVLFFDAAQRLVKVERGLLHDFIQPSARHPPATVEDG
jgi:hypothetical protein